VTPFPNLMLEVSIVNAVSNFISGSYFIKE